MHRSTLLMFCLLCGGVALGCDEDEGPPATPGVDGGADSGAVTPLGEQVVELYSPWGSAGDAHALQSVFDLHRKRLPNVNITNAAFDSFLVHINAVNERMANGAPPDLFQETASTLPDRLRAYSGRHASVADLYDELGLHDTVAPEITHDMTYDGVLYGIPVSMHRFNSLLLNKAIFSAHNLAAPTTIADFLAACATLKASGIAPLAVAPPAVEMFASIVLGVMGPEAFDEYFSGKRAGDDPTFVAALDVFATVMEEYTHASTSDPNQAENAPLDLVFRGEAAMLFQSDWIKGYFQQLGWTPGIDFEMQASPGALDTFVYNVDLLLMPMDAVHTEAARELLKTFASREGQILFNNAKSSTPVRLDVDRSRLDPLTSASLTELERARVRLLARGRTEWVFALWNFMLGARDRAQLLRAFVDAPPLAREQ